MSNENQRVDAEAYWTWNIEPTTAVEPCHFGWCKDAPASVPLRVSGRRAPEVVRACPRCAERAIKKYDNVEIIGRFNPPAPPRKILMDAPKEKQIEAILLASVEGFLIEELSVKLSIAPHRVRAHVRELEKKGLIVRASTEGTYMDTVWHYPDEF